MRYFRNRDSMEEEVWSLDDLKQEFYKMTFEERDYLTFGEWLERCMTYNNGSLGEINSDQHFDNINAYGAEDLLCLIKYANSEEELNAYYRVAEEVLDLSWEYLRVISDHIALRKYKLERNIAEDWQYKNA